MFKEPFFAPREKTRASGSRENFAQTRATLLKHSKWGAIFAAGLALMTEGGQAEAQQRPQVGVSNVEFQAHTVSPRELNTRWQQALSTVRDSSVLRAADPSATLVCEGSVETEIARVGIVVSPPREQAHFPLPLHLMALEGHRIAVSSLQGEVAHTTGSQDQNNASIVDSLRFRVLDLSASVNLEPTGRHLVQDGEGQSMEQAMALAFEHLSRNLMTTGHVLESYQAQSAGASRSESLRIETWLNNNIATNVHIGTVEQLPNGHVRIHIEADEAREVPPQPHP